MEDYLGCRLLAIIGLLFSCCTVITTGGARVLVLQPMHSKSHMYVFMPIIEELAKRGHNITYVSVYEPPPAIAKMAAVETILLHEARAYADKISPVVANMNKFNLELFLRLGPFLQEICHQSLNDTKMKAFMKDPGTFDVVLVTALRNHCFLPVAALFKAPIVLVSPATLLSSMAWYLDMPFPLSYVPMPILPFHSPMSFVQRFTNVLMAHTWQVFDRYYFDSYTHEAVLKYLPDAPYSTEIARDVALVLVNSHISLQESRPLMPYVIDVGGMHCRPGNKIPEEFLTFIEGAGEDGFILFSMGSALQGQYLPNKTIEKLINVFDKVKPRVIWKFEKQLKGLLSNVMISGWMPQQDLIAHPKCRLAMTHGGLLSLQEVVYHGVPLLGFPQGVDRDGNIQTAIQKGFAEMLDLETVTEDAMIETINRMITEESYNIKAKEISAIVKDRPQQPVDSAAYWVEYVIRHKGAPHLKSGAHHLNIFQYILLDVYASFALILIVSVALMFYLAKFLWRCCGQQNRHKKMKKN